MTMRFEATFDYVCEPLRCPRCGRVAPDPCAIDLQCALARVRDLRCLRIGDRLDLLTDPTERDYLPLRERGEPGSLSAIEEWNCPSCGANFIWARLEFDQGVLRSVAATELTPDVLRSTDYISNAILMLIPPERTLAVKRLHPRELIVEVLAAEADHLSRTEDDLR